MITSITVHSNGGSTSTNTKTSNNASAIIADGGDLIVEVFDEDGAVIKEFYWRAGCWDNYSIIKWEEK